MNKVIVPCVVCGKEMLLCPSIAKQKRTCSKECAAKRVPFVVVECQVCGKRIVLPPSLAKTRKTCSRKCDAEVRRIMFKGNKFRAKDKSLPSFYPKKCRCEICGIEFYTKGRGQKGRFCSQKCISERAKSRIDEDQV